jgi:hypothetical protein
MVESKRSKASRSTAKNAAKNACGMSKDLGQEFSQFRKMSEGQLAELGGGKVAYIKSMSSDEANVMYPAVKGLPKGIELFALHAADGTPIALTDSRQAAIGHAMGDQLMVESLH